MKDGRRYSNEAMLYKRRARQNIIDLALANPGWNLTEIVTEQHKSHPGYTETAARVALREAGLVRSKPRTTYGPRKASPEPSKRAKVAQPPSTHRAAVHGYHGRSRLLSNYVEL